MTSVPTSSPNRLIRPLGCRFNEDKQNSNRILYAKICTHKDKQDVN